MCTFPTITAALSLYFSDDAMIERGVTKSVLKKICEENARLKQGKKKNVMTRCVFEKVVKRLTFFSERHLVLHLFVFSQLLAQERISCNKC